MVYALILLLTWLLVAVVVMMIPFYASRYRAKASNKIIRVFCAVAALTPAVVLAGFGGMVLSAGEGVIGHSSSYFAPIAAYLLSLIVFVLALSIFFVLKPKYLEGIALFNVRNALLLLLCLATIYGLCKIESRNNFIAINAEIDRLYAICIAENGGPGHKEQSSDNAVAANRFLFTKDHISSQVDGLPLKVIKDLKMIHEKQVGEVLEKHEDVIKELMRLFEKPEWITIETDEMPQIVDARRAVNLLLLHALRNYGDKQYQAAANALRVCRNISTHLRLSNYSLIGHLIANELDENIFDVMTAMVLNDSAQAAALGTVMHGSGELVFRGMHKALLGERLRQLNFSRHVFPESFNDVVNALFLKIIINDSQMMFKERLAVIDSMVARGEWDSKAGDLADENIPQMAAFPWIEANLNSYFIRIARVAALHEAEAAVIALVSYKTKKGHYPDTLQELVPDYLPAPVKTYVTGVGMGLEKSNNGGVALSIKGFPDWSNNKKILLKTEAEKATERVAAEKAATEKVANERTAAEFVRKTQDPQKTPAGMVYVKGGCFDMGKNKACLDDYYIDKTEVTQSAYKKVTGGNPSHFTGLFSGCPNCPVEMVNWDEANAYCGKLGKRLPTEQEWEYAATSGGQKEIYAGGRAFDRVGEYAWFKDNSGERTHPVGEKKPNGLGLYDMSGNVWEWTNSWQDGKKPGRIIRGGSWLVEVNGVRTVERPHASPDTRDSDFGFRCAQ